MLRTALLAISFAAIASSAVAVEAPKYDRKIEAAVKKIVAKKVGGIRGGFDTSGLTVINDDNASATVSAPMAAASGTSDDAKPVQVALGGVPTAIEWQKPSAYHSGRPEPLRKVRKISSFQYF